MCFQKINQTALIKSAVTLFVRFHIFPSSHLSVSLALVFIFTLYQYQHILFLSALHHPLHG